MNSGQDDRKLAGMLLEVAAVALVTGLVGVVVDRVRDSMEARAAKKKRKRRRARTPKGLH